MNARPLIFAMGNGAIGDGSTGIADDAAIGDVVLNMFESSHDDDRPKSFTEAVVTTAIDDLGVLELALSSGSSVDEAAKVIDRIRTRLLAARWLDSKLADAKGGPSNG